MVMFPPVVAPPFSLNHYLEFVNQYRCTEENIKSNILNKFTTILLSHIIQNMFIVFNVLYIYRESFFKILISHIINTKVSSFVQKFTNSPIFNQFFKFLWQVFDAITIQNKQDVLI